MLASRDGESVQRVVAMPTAALEIVDTWRTAGLRGTGSHDAVAHEVFVPSHRLLSLFEGPPAGSPPLYRFPLVGFFAASIAAATLGNARGAIEELSQLAHLKKSVGSTRTLAERPLTQSEVARSEAALRAARLLFFQAVDDAWQAAHSEEPVPDTVRTGLRLASAHATCTAADVVSSMYELAGGAAIYEESPLQRRFRDAHTATAHIQVSAPMFELTGRMLLGLPTHTHLL